MKRIRDEIIYGCIFALIGCSIFAQSGGDKERLVKQATEYEMLILANAEDSAAIDIGYYVSIESLNDLPTDDTTYDFDYINYGGGAAVISLLTGMFEPELVNLLQSPHVWQGPYVNFDPARVSISGAGYDEGTLLDLWGNPYYLFTPLGLVKPQSRSISLELYGDQFDRYAIVSLGPDGIKSGDDIIRLFGGAPTWLVLSSTTPSPVQRGEEVTVRGYNFGDTQGPRNITLNGAMVSDIITWSDRAVIFIVPSDAESGYVRIIEGSFESNAVYLSVQVEQTSVEDTWILYN